VRLLRTALLVLLALLLIVVALANREPVTLRFLPEAIGAYVGITRSVEVPLFVALFGGIVAGLLIGFVWEWFREHKHRAAAARARREAETLSREVARTKPPAARDEVLELIEPPRKAS
jgi:uncharacterized integral membrane protein